MRRVSPADMRLMPCVVSNKLHRPSSILIVLKIVFILSSKNDTRFPLTVAESVSDHELRLDNKMKAAVSAAAHVVRGLVWCTAHLQMGFGTASSHRIAPFSLSLLIHTG